MVQREEGEISNGLERKGREGYLEREGGRLKHALRQENLDTLNGNEFREKGKYSCPPRDTKKFQDSLKIKTILEQI